MFAPVAISAFSIVPSKILSVVTASASIFAFSIAKLAISSAVIVPSVILSEFTEPGKILSVVTALSFISDSPTESASNSLDVIALAPMSAVPIVFGIITLGPPKKLP